MIAVLALAAALHDLDALQAQAASVVGHAVVIDPRLRLPRCTTTPVVEPGPSAVALACPAPAWRVYAAVGGGPAAIRRGDTVSVVAAGPGFRVALDGVAEAAAAIGGPVRLRMTGSGARIIGRVEADGSVSLPD